MKLHTFTTPEGATLTVQSPEQGMAGQFGIAYHCAHTINSGAVAGAFYSSTYGGPIVNVFQSGFQTRVDRPERFGDKGLTVEWVAAYFGVTP